MRIFLNVKMLLPVLFVSVFGCKPSGEKQSEAEQTPAEATPVNVILLIGDGMGLSQVSAAFFFGEGKSNFERFPHTGLMKTSSTSHKITDSAAGATAFAQGEKTYNGAIGVDKDGNPLKSITQILAGKNYKNGVISTSSITHATPACFFATAAKRSEEELIASQMHLSEIDFFAGGGLKFFHDREDEVDYVDSLAAKGYEVVTDGLQDASMLDSSKKYGFLLADVAMPMMTEGRGDFLEKATKTAAGFLGSPGTGFFLMVEGSQIDWGGHANDGEYTIAEVIDFDKAIGAALDFAEKDGNTLVVVTADHETGGFTLSSNTVKDESGNSKSDYDELMATFSTGGHSATLIPVFAYGPGAEKFSGVYENTEIFHKILEITGK